MYNSGTTSFGDNTASTESDLQLLERDMKTIEYPLDKYEIKVVVNANNEFVGIEEIKINKDFVAYKQEDPQKGYHDVEQYYR